MQANTTSASAGAQIAPNRRAVSQRNRPVKQSTKASKASNAMTVPAMRRSMQSRLIGRSAMTSSSAAPTAQTVSPAIMIANARAVTWRRRQAAKAKAPDSAAATPMGIAAGLFWNVIIPAPTRPQWKRFSNPWVSPGSIPRGS